MFQSFAFRLPPAIGKATAGGKTAKRQHGMWERGLGRLAGMARQKNNTMQNGGREALSFHATPAQRTMRMGQAAALSGAAAAASATCTAAGAMKQSGRRGRPPADLGDGMRGRGRRRGYKKMPPDRG